LFFLSDSASLSELCQNIFILVNFSVYDYVLGVMKVKKQVCESERTVAGWAGTLLLCVLAIIVILTI